ncbi:sulfatase, partial [bacterium]|nr:sulfatase [candidate division CSSED10-310 bacterium]
GIAIAISSETGSDPAPRTIPESLKDKPNIVFIMCDALRADHLGCYGYPHAETPVLDSLAESAIRFHDAYAQASWTKPSTATLFTALYPSGHKTYLKPDVLPDDVTTVAEVFQSAGYHTIGFPNNINISPSFNFDQGFTDYIYLAPDYFFGANESTSKLTYYAILRKVREGFLVSSKYPRHYYQEAAIVNQHAIDYIVRHGNTDRFFLYLHYMEPHDPFFVHPFNGVGYARVTMPNPDPSWAEAFRAAYDQEIAYMDHRIGELFDALKAQKLWDNTVILVTADHGEEFYDHLGWWHGTSLYQELIRIPMIIKLHAEAAEIRPPTVRLDRARHIDVAPTLLGLAELPAPETMSLGRNLFAVGEDILRDITVFAEEDHEGNVLSAFIEGPWKVITANEGNPRGLAEDELYRLDIDPLEKQNRTTVEPDVLHTMKSGLELSRYSAMTGAVERQTKTLSEDEISKMRELGYIQE